MDRLLHEKSRLFANADPYQVSEYVNQHVGTHGIRMPGKGKPAASLSHRSFGGLDLCRISYGCGVQVTSHALQNVYHLQVLLKGHCLWRGQGQEHRLTPGELLLINPDDPVDLTYSADCEKFIVKLPKPLLERACSDNHWKCPTEGIRFAPRQHQPREGFGSLLSIICEEAESDYTLPTVQEHYTRIIANKLLALMESNVTRAESPEANPSFERVLEFVEENLKHDISLEQLAALARVSPRSLYSLFDKHLGTTPKHYIRRRKLERVHSYLLDPTTKVRSVTEVALDYGFLHLGRFSESYKNAFGELPSETLKRREGQ